ncbi:UNVERIFIED_CONTAM: hypothetical protein Slati_3917900 [Sesamum latifolium]|uniref:RNase H type-1 domain-containing protein n=1 Tax=Sesamum latifolium TaxID=2727402 RepID=A0AAW2TMF5_9LAMI
MSARRFRGQKKDTPPPLIEKLAFSLVVAARKLRHYFQSHPVVVLTNHPLKQVLAEPNILGRMVKWAVELSEYGIESSTSQGSGAGVILEIPQGYRIQYALRFNFDASKNEAEYEALLAGMKLAQAAGARHVRAFSDSQLVVNQVKGNFEAKEQRMAQYLDLVRTFCQTFERFELECIPRSDNEEADQLAKLASSVTAIRDRNIILLNQEHSEIEEATKEVLVNSNMPCWKDAIEAYLTAGSLPSDKKEARAVITRAARFTMIAGELYKRGFS